MPFYLTRLGAHIARRIGRLLTHRRNLQHDRGLRRLQLERRAGLQLHIDTDL
jgi:hypothetical protein